MRSRVFLREKEMLPKVEMLGAQKMGLENKFCNNRIRSSVPDVVHITTVVVVGSPRSIMGDEHGSMIALHLVE